MCTYTPSTKTGSHVAQAGLDLTREPSLASNLWWFSCLSLPSDKIKGMWNHTWQFAHILYSKGLTVLVFRMRFQVYRLEHIICGPFTFSNSASICDRRAGFSSSKNIRKEGPTYRYITPSNVMAEVLTACRRKQKELSKSEDTDSGNSPILHMLECTHWVCGSKSGFHITNESFDVQPRRNNICNRTQTHT